jgi:hypothetical protein
MRRVYPIFLSVLVAVSASASVHNVPRQKTASRVTERHVAKHVTKRRHRARLRRVRFYGPPVTPALRGSRDSLLKQNSEIDQAGLERIENDEQLLDLENRGVLIPLAETRYLKINPELDDSRRYTRPWTAQFVSDMSKEFYDKFHKPLQVTSAVRTIEQQRRLMRHNGNAAPAEGEIASSHLAGTTIDIGKRGLTRKEHKWVADYLANLKDQNVIEPEEERRQACFHIMVLNRYPVPIETPTMEAEVSSSAAGVQE